MRHVEARDTASGEEEAGLRLGSDDLATCGSLALLLIAAYLLNAYIFPSVAFLFPAGREISTYCGVGFSVVVAVASYRQPAVFRENPWSLTCLGLFAVGLAMLGAGLMADSPLLVALGSPFGGIGSVWFSVLVGLALVKLGTKRSMVVIPTAFVAKYAVQFGLVLMGDALDLLAALVLYFACTTASYLLIRPRVHRMITAIRESASPTVLDLCNTGEIACDKGVAGPHGIDNVNLFNAACGYAFGSQGQMMPQAATLLSFVPVVVVFFIVVAARARLVADALYRVSALLVFAGFLLVPLSFNGLDRPAGFHMSSMLLYAGSDCFSVLTYYLIAAVGSRNPAGALSTSAFAIAAGWLGIGCGALLVQSIEALGALDGSTLLWSSAIVTFLFMTYNFVAMRGFSFEDAIKGVRPAHPTPARAAADEAGEDPDTSQLEESCENVIRRFGLTPREGDVLRLLARGRTSPVIQEKLFLSHNTVKTHVRHIYAKMDIHSQQELIDIVEGADA